MCIDSNTLCQPTCHTQIGNGVLHVHWDDSNSKQVGVIKHESQLSCLMCHALNGSAYHCTLFPEDPPWIQCSTFIWPVTITLGPVWLPWTCFLMTKFSQELIFKPSDCLEKLFFLMYFIWLFSFLFCEILFSMLFFSFLYNSRQPDWALEEFKSTTNLKNSNPLPQLKVWQNVTLFVVQYIP